MRSECHKNSFPSPKVAIGVLAEKGGEGQRRVGKGEEGWGKALPAQRGDHTGCVLGSESDGCASSRHGASPEQPRHKYLLDCSFSFFLKRKLVLLWVVFGEI